MPKRGLDCSTQSIQVLVLSNISSSPNKQELGHVSGPKQTGQTLQLYITKGWTENPINKSTHRRFSTTKPSSRDDENIFFTSQAKQSEQTADAFHQNSCANQMDDFGVWCASSAPPLSFQWSLCIEDMN